MRQVRAQLSFLHVLVLQEHISDINGRKRTVSSPISPLKYHIPSFWTLL